MAHTDADLELLRVVARQRLAAGQGALDLRLPDSPVNQGAALPITSSRTGHLLDALGRSFEVLGFGMATGATRVGGDGYSWRASAPSMSVSGQPRSRRLIVA